MYTLRAYGEMIADRVRTEAYAEALRRAVKPGCVVLEIGTGPGLFAILACQFGAGRVFAIESSEVIQVARENAAANGCAERITFFEDISTRVTLPAKADVIISDLHGALPLLQQHIPSIADARHRFLAPGGVLIPRQETLWAAVVEEPKLYDGIVEPWERNGFDQDLSAARRRAINNPQKTRVKPGDLLTAPEKWAKLDYESIESPDASGELVWSVQRAGTGHGIVLWFDSELAEGVSISNAPGSPEAIYGSMFFPWERPIPLAAGQKVRAQLEAKLLKDDYVWRWRTEMGQGGPAAQPAVEFDQSTVKGAVISPVQLRKTVSDFVPQPTEAGRVDRRILELMDGRATLEEIAKKLAAEFPKRFARWQDALGSAAAVSQKYGQ